jgi:hypothetical protein
MSIPPTPQRACGERKPGGIYVEVALDGPFYVSVQTWIEEAMADPPLPAARIVLELPSGELITADEVGARGQVVARRLGERTWHIWDVVGRRDYPYPADFLEEVRTEGLSRRSPKTLRFDLLDEGSRIFLLHDLGWLHPADEYYARIPSFTCPAGRAHPPGEMCAGLWWCDIDEADCQPVEGGEAKTFQGLPLRKRRIAQRTYRCAARPAGLRPQRARALIASFPIWRLAVVRSSDGGHEDGERRAARAGLPVALVEA